MQTGQWTGGATNTTIVTQVLICALATALNTAFSGNNTLVAISILGGAPILAVSYLVLVRGSNEHRTSLLRVKALDDFLNEIEAFQLGHGHKVGREWDEKVNFFRVSLENMLEDRTGSTTINSEPAGSLSDSDAEVLQIPYNNPFRGRLG